MKKVSKPYTKSYLKRIEQLAGSIKIPKKYRHLSPDQAIEKAKIDYFGKKLSDYK